MLLVSLSLTYKSKQLYCLKLQMKMEVNKLLQKYLNKKELSFISEKTWVEGLHLLFYFEHLDSFSWNKMKNII